MMAAEHQHSAIRFAGEVYVAPAAAGSHVLGADAVTDEVGRLIGASTPIKRTMCAMTFRRLVTCGTSIDINNAASRRPGSIARRFGTPSKS